VTWREFRTATGVTSQQNPYFLKVVNADSRYTTRRAERSRRVFTRMSNRLIRPALFAGVLACSAAFVDVARAGVPSTPAAPAAATATQSAVAPPAAVAAVAPEAPATPSSAASALPAAPAPVAPGAPPVPAEPKVATPPIAPANSAPAVQTAPVAAAVSAAHSTTTTVTSTVTSTVARTTTVATHAAAAVVTRAGEMGGSTIHAATTNATSVLDVTSRTAADLAQRTAPSSAKPIATSTPASASALEEPTVTPTTSAPAAGGELVSRPSTGKVTTVAPATPGRLDLSSTAPRLSDNQQPGADASGSSPAPLPRLPWPSPVGIAAAVGAVGGSGLLLFGLLAFAFLLAIPNAVRWLRSALALGLSPAYVALSDRPG
jgi:hypothetical protein